MQKLPFRTNTTWLTDDQLVLLDALFDADASFRPLRAENFCERNLGYSHNLDDGQLQCHLHWLCEHGVLEAKRHGDATVFRMTPDGGELWSLERCPVWERFCMDRYTTISGDGTLMSVTAVSAEVRDQFLSLWPFYSSWPFYPRRRRTATIVDRGLIGWHPFDQLFVGLATYCATDEQKGLTSQQYTAWLEHQAMVERERSWWRTVRELQRFVLPVPGPTQT